jgi:hypothetical protein
MGLMDTLRKAEERSREAARRLERALGLEDKGRALRRKMRIVPGNAPGAQQSSAAAPPTGRTPIISINGRDVPADSGNDRRTA